MSMALLMTSVIYSLSAKVSALAKSCCFWFSVGPIPFFSIGELEVRVATTAPNSNAGLELVSSAAPRLAASNLLICSARRGEEDLLSPLFIGLPEVRMITLMVRMLLSFIAATNKAPPTKYRRASCQSGVEVMPKTSQTMVKATAQNAVVFKIALLLT